MFDKTVNKGSNAVFNTEFIKLMNRQYGELRDK